MKKQGFTLIEVLVVIAIIGLLATITMSSLNVVRQKSRDAKRAADVRQYMVALGIYFNSANLYPVEATPIVLGSASYDCFDEDGFVASCDVGGTTYIGNLPANPTPGGADYMYTSVDGSTYNITLELERGIGDYSAGVHTVTPSGIE